MVEERSTPQGGRGRFSPNMVGYSMQKEGCCSLVGLGLPDFIIKTDTRVGTKQNTYVPHCIEAVALPDTLRMTERVYYLNV